MRDEPGLFPASHERAREVILSWSPRLSKLLKRKAIAPNLIALLREMQNTLLWRNIQIDSSLVRLEAPLGSRYFGGELGMHQENVEAARAETLRLIDYTSNVLATVLAAPDFVRENEPDQARQMTRQKVKRWQSVLKNERNKVSHLEAVIAIVGATKAGKSTTINAVIGADILPNRSEPMTTYPTLVRHCPGASEATLSFPLAAEFMQVAQNAKAKLLALIAERSIKELFEHQAEVRAAAALLEGALDEISTTYKGKNEIVSFLERLNDFCRLLASQHIGLELPDPEKEDSLYLPTIEVSFYHIPPSGSSIGTLTILDSPGPNEVGQGNRLRQVVRRRIEEASAVVLICNCTEARTDSPRELQDLVKQFIGELSDRLFLFVNKIDQLDPAKDPPIASIPEEYSGAVLDRNIPPERIFPIAARSAFLANWALRELSINGRLPEPSADRLTQSFGMRALGEIWKETIGNDDLVRLGANRLWSASLFDKPLEEVIRMAADKAALISLKAASKKVLEYNRQTDSFLRLRETAATFTAHAIHEQILAIENDVQAIELARKASDKEVDELKTEFDSYMEALSQTITVNVQEMVDQLFQAGKRKEEEELQKRRQDRRSSFATRMHETLIKLGDSLLSVLGPNGDGEFPLELQKQLKKIGPLQGTRSFKGWTHRADAEGFVQQINDFLRGVFAEADEQAIRTIDSSISAFAEQIKANVAVLLDDILQRAQQRLQKTFNIVFTPPAFELQIRDLVTFDLEAGAVTDDYEYHTRYVEREGLLEPTKRWFADLFGKRWGYNEVTEREDLSVVDLGALKSLAMRQLGGFEAALKLQFQVFITHTLNVAINRYFSRLKRYLEEFRGDLTDALEDSNLEADRLQQLKGTIQQLLQDVEDLLVDAQNLASSLGAA